MSIAPGTAFVLIWLGFLAYLGAVVWAPRLGHRLIWSAIVLLSIFFASLPPLLSHDVYSYVDYARLDVLHGLNPYVHPPASVPSDPAFAEVEWTDTTSAYGPLFTLAALPLAHLPVDAAVYVLKAASAASVLATAWLVSRLAPARGVDRLRAAAFVALNPLVLVHVIGGPHNDALAVLLITLGVAGVLTARPLSAGAALAAAAATKASTLLAAPFVLLAVRPTGRRFAYIEGNRPVGRLLAGAGIAVVAVAGGAGLAFEWDWIGAFGLAGENQDRTSYMSIPMLMSRLTGFDPDLTRATALALFTALVIYLLIWTYRGGDWLRASAWATTGLLLATAWLLPWYLLWPLPAAALSRDTPLKLSLLVLTAYQLGARIPL